CAHLEDVLLRGRAGLNSSLCCGYAGQGFALLAMHRHTGDQMSLRLAAEVCRRAIDGAPEALQRSSLFHGDLGVALLAEALARPNESSMPLFEAEGWARSEA
ncbi:MAG TPA: lanthionine synthetase LanC family protein, partial [Polyangiaceae bacterium]|nr:lanthionine synthetase LanC family protein [Polyangiaceae bacterium]